MLKNLLKFILVWLILISIVNGELWPVLRDMGGFLYGIPNRIVRAYEVIGWPSILIWLFTLLVAGYLDVHQRSRVVLTRFVLGIGLLALLIAFMISINVDVVSIADTIRILVCLSMFVLAPLSITYWLYRTIFHVDIISTSAGTSAPQNSKTVAQLHLDSADLSPLPPMVLSPPKVQKQKKRVFNFSGQETRALPESVFLEAGTYYVDYKFPPPARRREQYTYGHFEYVDSPSAELIVTELGETWPEVRIRGSGSGSQTFTLRMSNAYVVQVKCDEGRSSEKWSVECYSF